MFSLFQGSFRMEIQPYSFSCLKHSRSPILPLCFCLPISFCGTFSSASSGMLFPLVSDHLSGSASFCAPHTNTIHACGTFLVSVPSLTPSLLSCRLAPLLFPHSDWTDFFFLPTFNFIPFSEARNLVEDAVTCPREWSGSCHL